MTIETNEVRGQSLDCAREFVRADDAGKWDTIVPRQNVQMCDGRLSFGGTEQPLSPSTWATGQLCARLGIPSPYFRKCPTDLQDEQANYWLEHGPQKRGETWLLRAKDENLRAVLSDRYSPLDNATLLDELRMLLPDSYRVDWFGLQDESLHLRVVDPTRTRELLPDDALTVGIHLVNSEVGLRSVTIDAMVFRLVCTNGLIRLVKGKSLLRQRHLHVSHHRFIGALGEAIDNALKESEGFLNQLAATTQTPVPDISDVMEKIAERWNLSDETQESAKLALRQENASQQESLYGLVNAYTSAAQKLPDSGRYDLEVLAGNLAQHGVAAFAPQRSSVSPRLPKQSETNGDNGHDEPFDVVETAREMFEAQVMSRSPRKEVVRS